jgi:hypothetical protein
MPACIKKESAKYQDHLFGVSQFFGNYVFPLDRSTSNIKNVISLSGTISQDSSFVK